jgi:hypothetical protein
MAATTHRFPSARCANATPPGSRARLGQRPHAWRGGSLFFGDDRTYISRRVVVRSSQSGRLLFCPGSRRLWRGGRRVRWVIRQRCAVVSVKTAERRSTNRFRGVKLCGGLPSLVLMDQPVGSEQETPAGMVLDLVGVFEAAEVLGITRSAFAARRRSHRTFPPPLAELRCGPVWFRWQIQAYAAEEQRLGRRGWYGRRIGR